MTTIQSAFVEEQKKLEQTFTTIDQQLKKLSNIPRYQGNDLTEIALDEMRQIKRKNLEISWKEPYFGRMDFQESGKKEPVPLYIGKVGVEEDRSNQLLVIDWRAPVASMYYSFTGAEETASYESPDGIIEGQMYLKRNLVIRDKSLQRVVDSYVKGQDNLGVVDEFLLYRLEENKDNRLRDIVSTIQEEQDKIIRAPKNMALIIQGVAGSGKTTVALHRLAYLLYQYRENLRAEKMIIFAPNSMFLDYISGVLPELGVGDIQQTTFTNWALEQLNGEVQLADPSKKLSHWFESHAVTSDSIQNSSARYKGSIDFRNLVDRFLDAFEATFVPLKAFVPWEGTILPTAEVEKWFYEEYRHYPLLVRRDRIIARIKRFIEMELKKMPDGSVKKDRKKRAAQKVREFAKLFPSDTPFQLYRAFLQDHKEKKHTYHLPDIQKDVVDTEDLPPILHIRNRLFGIEGRNRFDHTVIDEAQDFSPYQIALLQEYTNNNSFTILGDLSQGIHAYQGIHAWEEFMEIFPEEQTSFFRLNRSYRSTMEILNFANQILKRMNEQTILAQPVFRSGEQVRLYQVTKKNRIHTIIDSIHDMQQSSHTIAIICRTLADCRELLSGLLANGIEAELIDSVQKEYKGGLSLIPVYLSKGLEFDAVLAVDVDSTRYQLTSQDSKLLYVACTRALHQLRLIFEGEPSPLVTDIPDTVVEGV